MVDSPVQLIRPRRHGDASGWSTETYNCDTFTQLGVNVTFVQNNRALAVPAFTLRGTHFQTPPGRRITWCAASAGEFWTWRSMSGSVRRLTATG
jgi:dTDP-4-dehydrorhamnose 3,5-epimerase-like enzyme